MSFTELYFHGRASLGAQNTEIYIPTGVLKTMKDL